jgi:hypothetical protein
MLVMRIVAATTSTGCKNATVATYHENRRRAYQDDARNGRRLVWRR